MKMLSDTHIAIAGAGPIGMTLALGLGLDGHHVTVYEKCDQLSAESRASTFHPATLEELSSYGVVDQLRAGAVEVRDYQYRDRREGMIAKLDYAAIADRTRYPFRLQIEQSELTRIILSRLADLPNVTVEFGSQIVSATTTADQVELVVETKAGLRTVHPTFAVGTDGANSAVRKSLGIPFEGITYPERYLVASTPFEFRNVMPDLSWVNYISDPEEWLLMLRTPNYWRVMFPLSPEVEHADATSPEAIQARLHTVYDLCGDFPLLHTTVYNVHQRVADTYTQGRVVLAGDAAHINNPLGGLGMNSGLFDAFALRRHFAAISEGADFSDMLRRYSDEQRQVSIEYVGAQTDRNWSQLRETDPQRRRQQALHMREIVADRKKERDFLLRVSMFERELV
jgi:2-polyprenyl-6-methoxyphenol hydroxylase-like FAD-dependent oxidoreductase